IEVLQEDTGHAGGLEGSELLGDLVDAADEPGLLPLVEPLCGRSDHATGHERERQRGGVAAHRFAGAVERAATLAALLRRREGRVVLLRDAGRQPGAARLRGTAEDHRRVRALYGLRLLLRVVRPGTEDRVGVVLQLVEALAEGREGKAVRFVLGLVPAGAETELDAAARDVVGGDDHARDYSRMPECHRRDHRAEADS